MTRLQANIRLSPPVATLLDQLCELRGLSRSEIVLIGILAQAEAFQLIPSMAAAFADHYPPPKTDPDLRTRLRASQQRSRSRKQGLPVPKRKPGPKPRA